MGVKTQEQEWDGLVERQLFYAKTPNGRSFELPLLQTKLGLKVFRVASYVDRRFTLTDRRTWAGGIRRRIAAR
jgi:hypothetical protein